MSTDTRPARRPRGRGVETTLALAVLNLLGERPMHPYEMKGLMRERGHERAIHLKDASLYDTVKRLERLGLIDATEVSRAGRRPERTVYAITDAGRHELYSRLVDLLRTPVPEYPRLAGALMFIYTVGKEGAIDALAARAGLLEADVDRVDAERAAADRANASLPRLFGIEDEYAQTMRRAELAWLREIVGELHDGTLEWPVLADVRTVKEGLAAPETPRG